eukprot:6458087-Amphidinium_carterae.3
MDLFLSFCRYCCECSSVLREARSLDSIERHRHGVQGVFASCLSVAIAVNVPLNMCIQCPQPVAVVSCQH